ncbi:DUF58 domain-containing protein [Bacillus lacus]|uniref:DUF58 domain-containing protein n=1 Tax=Metabacillus lacus TaxID=1983721 RepID=A0A7X2J3H4_9BACI|nr:DUF58 domain-containing protein [Metabacillus lacus]MRX74128.1 DUF58 domain-containing protein [Metabacillus lacus]
MKQLAMKIKLPWKLATLLLLMAATFSYAMFQGGFVSWFLFYAFLPFALYSFLLLLYPVGKFSAERRLNQERFSVGEKLAAEVTISRKVPFPLFYLIVEEVLPEKLNGTKGSKKILFPWFRRSFSVSYQLDNMPRGEHAFTGIRLRTGDLLGLIDKEALIILEDHFLVYPHYKEMKYHQNTRQIEQGGSSNHKKLWDNSTLANGIREYQPGDRFAWIDWKATARRDSIMIKEFEQTQSHDVLILMDRSPTPDFEQIVSFTASVIRAVLKSGASIEFVSLGREHARFPMQSGEAHLRNIFYHLAKADCDAEDSFAKVFEQVASSQQKKASKILVTGALTMELDRKIERNNHLGSTLLFIVKNAYGNIANEEKVMIDRLTKRGIFVKVIREGRFQEAFETARESG